MGETIRLNFGPPKFTIRRFPIPRKPGPVFFEMPVGSQLLGIEAPEHDPAILFFWAVPNDDRPKVRSKFLVVEEGQPFTVEECSGIIELDDGSVYEELHTHLEPVGFWVETGEDGSVRTIHVLELVDDDDVDDEETEDDGAAEDVEEPDDEEGVTDEVEPSDDAAEDDPTDSE